MEGAYGKGKYCPTRDRCLDLEDITKIMATSRDAKELLDVWGGWHAIAAPMQEGLRRASSSSPNKGARELGFEDTGAMWRSKYDMPPDAFAAELDRLWEQVRPLYVSLHAYVRWKLREKYGDAVPGERADPGAPARQHVGAGLGQHLPARRAEGRRSGLRPDADPQGAQDRRRSQMVRYGEGFFTSLGFDPLPETFWERSLFTKPRDREVVCHASAWDVDFVDDLRIKMCIEITDEDFTTIHHELGHNFYQRAYDKQPILFRDSANDGFHEAIGDTIALSVTPEYLVKLGLLDKAPGHVQGHRPAAAARRSRRSRSCRSAC